MNTEFYSLSAEKNNGETISFENFKGKTVLIVNTASKCGFTPQYDGLQALYEKYKNQGLVILGFPCDQFGHQEPGSGEEIQQFCKINFGVTFPLFSKIEVNGSGAHPLYKFLKRELPGTLGFLLGGRIKWNFTKFLIDSEGRPVKRFDSTVKPEDLEKEITPWMTIPS